MKRTGMAFIVGGIAAVALISVPSSGWSEHENKFQEQRVKEAMKYAPEWVESVARAGETGGIARDFVQQRAPILYDVAEAGKKVNALNAQLFNKVIEVETQLRVVQVKGAEVVVQLDREGPPGPGRCGKAEERT